MSLEELESLGITEDSMRAAIEGSHRGWLCEENGEVGGFVMGDSGNGELTVIALLPEHEGKGIGNKAARQIDGSLTSVFELIPDALLVLGSAHRSFPQLGAAQRIENEFPATGPATRCAQPIESAIRAHLHLRSFRQHLLGDA